MKIVDIDEMTRDELVDVCNGIMYTPFYYNIETNTCIPRKQILIDDSIETSMIRKYVKDCAGQEKKKEYYLYDLLKNLVAMNDK